VEGANAFGVPEAVELARALGQLPQHFIVYRAEGKAFAAGVGLSAEVERASDQVAARMLGDLRQNLPIDSSEAEN
jgi:hydrogenase maturation protease